MPKNNTKYGYHRFFYICPKRSVCAKIFAIIVDHIRSPDPSHLYWTLAEY